jgi:hypothetical protein
VLTVALFIVIPMMWSGMMAWVGFKVGAVVHDAVKNAHEAGTNVGELTAKAIKDEVGKAIKDRFKK